MLAFAAAVACARLGVWQLDRLAERRAVNARLYGRLEAPPVPLAGLPRDTASARYRRVLLAGTWDLAREAALVSRTRNGSPGVNLVTPLRIPGRDTAVLVNRGWVYAQDARRVAEPARWRPPRDTADGVAFVDVFPAGLAGEAAGVEAGVLRRLDPPAIAARYPYPIAPYYLVVLPSREDTTTRRDSTPARLDVPPMSDGPHRSYAIQWFSFAAVAIVGGLAFGRSRGRGARPADGDPPILPSV